MILTRGAARLAALLFLLPAAANAQNAYEIQVYGSSTVPRGRTFAELHTNTAFRGPPEGPGSLQPDQRAYHETLELTRGFTPWFEAAFYTFSSARSGEGWRWAGHHLRPRVRVPDTWGWPIGAGLSAEAGYLEPRFSESRWDLEIRPILDFRSGPFYAAVNPALERALSLYAGGSCSFTFAPAAKAAWEAFRGAALGAEYFGNTGPVENFSPGRRQQHQLFAVMDLDPSPAWEFNAGIGFGLTRASDALVLKIILGRRLGGD